MWNSFDFTEIFGCPIMGPVQITISEPAIGAVEDVVEPAVGNYVGLVIGVVGATFGAVGDVLGNILDHTGIVDETIGDFVDDIAGSRNIVVDIVADIVRDAVADDFAVGGAHIWENSYSEYVSKFAYLLDDILDGLCETHMVVMT